MDQLDKFWPTDIPWQNLLTSKAFPYAPNNGSLHDKKSKPKRINFSLNEVRQVIRFYRTHPKLDWRNLPKVAIRKTEKIVLRDTTNPSHANITDEPSRKFGARIRF